MGVGAVRVAVFPEMVMLSAKPIVVVEKHWSGSRKIHGDAL